MKLTAVTKSAVLARPIVVKFSDDDILHVKVNAVGISEATQAKFNKINWAAISEATEQDEVAVRAAKVFRKVLSELVASWDLTDDDGEPIAPTTKGLAEVGPVNLMLLLAGILGEIKAQNAARAAGPFEPTETPSAPSTKPDSTPPSS